MFSTKINTHHMLAVNIGLILKNIKGKLYKIFHSSLSREINMKISFKKKKKNIERNVHFILKHFL